MLLVLTLSIVSIHAAFLLTVGILSAVYRRHNPRGTALMLYRSLTSGPQTPPDFLPLTEMPAPLVRAIVYIEDFGFYRHHGFDVESIRHAIRLNRRLGYRAYGGSTITQQLARTLFLLPHKTYLRKYFELLAAVEIELIVPKNRILELYLNCIEWGNGTWGVRNAALEQFGAAVAGLSPDEVARLVAIMPSPRRYDAESFESNPILTRRYEAVRRYLQRTAASPPELRSELTRVR